MTDTELEERLFKKDKEPSIYLEPDYEALSRELNRKGVTKKLLWEEYIQQCDMVGKTCLNEEWHQQELNLLTRR